MLLRERVLSSIVILYGEKLWSMKKMDTKCKRFKSYICTSFGLTFVVYVFVMAIS